MYYPFPSAQSSTGVSLSNYLMATMFAGNRATFRNSFLSSDRIISLIKRGIQVRISGDRPDVIRNFWAFRNVLYSVSFDVDPSFFPLL